MKVSKYLIACTAGAQCLHNALLAIDMPLLYLQMHCFFFPSPPNFNMSAKISIFYHMHPGHHLHLCETIESS